LDLYPKEGAPLNPPGGRKIINKKLTTVKLKAGLVSLDRFGFFAFRKESSLIELNLPAKGGVTIHTLFKGKEIKLPRLTIIPADDLSLQVTNKKTAELW
jgi:hypothetical protein